MTRGCIVGGLRFITDRWLPDFPDVGFSDLDIRVTFTDGRPQGQHLRGPGGTSGYYEVDDKMLVLRHQGDDQANAWLLRQMAPIVSSVEHRLVLHASAVLLPRGIVAFIGESGAGKSTLAEAFSTPVADDLLAVRFEATVVADAGETVAPLAEIHFLVRSNAGPRRELLGAQDALQLDIAHGFGEHGDPRTWAFQFTAYHRLTRAVPHYRLTIPDDIAALRDVATFIEANP
jgi:hypothetical protein